jgi:tetrahydromethanopterin S-methyltransferase subunit F
VRALEEVRDATGVIARDERLFQIVATAELS